MRFGVAVLVMNDEGKLLSVSRKDDKTDFGLPGGKVEPGETPIEAAFRELFEETGYKIINPQYAKMIYHAEIGNELSVTYQVALAGITREKIPTETAEVEWHNPEVLANSKTFGEYNKGLFRGVGLQFETERYKYGMATKKKISNNNNPF